MLTWSKCSELHASPGAVLYTFIFDSHLDITLSLPDSLDSTQVHNNFKNSINVSLQKAADPSPYINCSSSNSPTVQSNTVLRAWQLIIVIGSLCLGIFLYGLDVNIVGVAIPRITTDFGSLDNVAWYGSAYLLTVTAFQPGLGSLYKYFNTKLVYMASLLIFEGKVPNHISDSAETKSILVSSAVCAAAPSSNVLIFGRAFLGVGAAGLLQGALAIISNVVPLQKVPQYQGIVISAMGISVCLGPIVGGALVQYANWRMYDMEY